MALPNIIQQINSKLPLSGGTLSGPLNRTGVLGQLNTDTSAITIAGGTDTSKCSVIHIYGQNHSTQQGTIQLRSYYNGSYTDLLLSHKNGTFTLGGNNIITSAGGTISGKLYFTGSHIINNKTGGEIRLVCDDAGTVTSRPALILFEKGNSSYPGFFYLRSANGTNTSDLIGKPDGTLTWGGKHVVRIDAQSTDATGYRKYADGFRIQWGRINVNECAKTTVTLPIAFSNANYHVDVCNASGKTVADTEGVMTVCEYATTNFKISTGYINPNTSAAVWFACGY